MPTQAMMLNVKLAETMGTITKTMDNMNKMMNSQQVAKTMQEFDMVSTSRSKKDAKDATGRAMMDKLDGKIPAQDVEAEEVCRILLYSG